MNVRIMDCEKEEIEKSGEYLSRMWHEDIRGVE